MPVAMAVRRRFQRAYRGVQTLLVGAEEIYDDKYTTEEALGTKIGVWDAQDDDPHANDSQATLTLPLRLVAKIHPNLDDLLKFYDSESDSDSLPEDDESDCSSVCSSSYTATDSASTVSGRVSFDIPYISSQSEFWNDHLDGVKLNEVRRVGQDENGRLYATGLSPPPRRASRIRTWDFDAVMDMA